MRGPTRTAVLLLAALWAPIGLRAQESAPTGPRRVARWTAAPPVASPLPIDLPRVSPAIATGASLILPGTGQLLLGKPRWAAYAGLEIAGWLIHLDRTRAGHRLRNQYLDVAWMVARSASPQPRLEGDWEYYERIGSWPRSGRFDADATRAGVQPEIDTKSFNGATWELARDLYLAEGAGEGSPSYLKALDYYQKRAYAAELAWDWTGKEEGLARYRSLISQSDESLRTATVVLGAVVANHLLSAVDAFVSSHVPAVPLSAHAGVAVLPTGPVMQWSVEFRP
jgi:hypothetical protein